MARRSKESRHGQTIRLRLNANSGWFLCLIPFSLRGVLRLACVALILALPASVDRMRPLSNAEAARAPPQTSTTVYATAVGERLVVTLDDGSMVELNSNSQLSVTFSPSTRLIELTQGEAFFRVKHQKGRPFRVNVGQMVVEDIATAFDVNKTTHAVITTVVEGRIKAYSPKVVALHPELTRVGIDVRSQAQEISGPTFGQGQQLELPQNAQTFQVLPTLSTNALARRLAWREGRRLDFDNAPLDEVIDAFSRYHREHFQLADDALGRRRLTANFDPNSMEEFLQMLRLTFNLQPVSTESADGTIMITLSQDRPPPEPHTPSH